MTGSVAPFITVAQARAMEDAREDVRCELIDGASYATRRVTAYVRTARGWEEIVQSEGTIELDPLSVTLDVTELYDEAQPDGGP